MRERYNILCFSGGGFRGLFSAAVLAQLERDLLTSRDPRRQIREHFDLVIGTSTGALMAAGIALGKSGEELEAAFRKHGKEIFRHLSWHRTIKRMALFQAQYDTGPLNRAINDVIGKVRADARLDQIDAKLAIVAVSQVEWRHRVFTAKPFAGASSPITLRDAILGSAAAPTYFEERHVKDVDRLIDGGLAANSPVLLGARILRKMFHVPLSKVYVLHVGTAAASVHNPIKQRWRSPIQKYRQLVETTLACQEAVASDVCETVFEGRYFKLDRPAGLGSHEELRALDDASASVEGKLVDLARTSWEYARSSPLLRSFFDGSNLT